MITNYRSIEKLLEDLKKEGKIELAGKWQGTEDFSNHKMMVLRNINLHLDINNKENLRDITRADQPWSEMHFLERINGIPSNPGETYKIWPYANFDKDHRFKDDKFSHTYMERFWPKRAGSIYTAITCGIEEAKCEVNEGIRFDYGDLKDVIQLLTNNVRTRQAYLPIWFPEDTWAASNGHRVPCTLGYHFYLENGKLNMNYTIRSCDAFRHFRNDLYLTYRLLIHVAKETGLQVGTLNTIIYHLHLFVNDLYMFNKKENQWKTE